MEATIYWNAWDWDQIGSYRTFNWRNPVTQEPKEKKDAPPCRLLPERHREVRGTIGEWLRGRLSCSRKISTDEARQLWESGQYKKFKDDLQAVILDENQGLRGLDEISNLPYYSEKVSYYTHRKYGRGVFEFQTPKGTLLFSPGGWVTLPFDSEAQGAYPARFYFLRKDR